MLKRILATTLVATALLFSGCGDEAGADRLEAQNAIDTGNPGAAIGLLADKLANGTATNDEKGLLADAYASQAGFTITDIAIGLMEASDGTGGPNAFVNLADTLYAQASSTSIDDLTSAIDAYELIAPAERTDDQNFKLGLIYITKMTLLVKQPSPDTTVVANTAIAGFDTIVSILPLDMQTNVDGIKSAIDDDGDGIIESTDLDALLLSGTL